MTDINAASAEILLCGASLWWRWFTSHLGLQIRRRNELLLLEFIRKNAFFITTRKLDVLFCRENPISAIKELKMICCGGQYFISNLTSALRNTSIVELLTEVVCNLLVEHNVLDITRLRRAQRPQIFNGKLLI